MADFAEIPLELQLREAHRQIQDHIVKLWKLAQFLSPIFLWWFPAMMDNQISVQWDTMTGLFDRSPIFPITLRDTKILDGWNANPSMWEVDRSHQHSR